MNKEENKKRPGMNPNDPLVREYVEAFEIFKEGKAAAVPVFEYLMEYPLDKVIELYKSGPVSAIFKSTEEKKELAARHLKLATEIKKMADAPKTIYLWKEGNMPQKTIYTANDNPMHHFIHEPDFVPHMYEVLLSEDVTPKGAVVVCAGGEHDDNILTEGLGSCLELNAQGYQCFLLHNRVNGNPWCPEDVGADVARAVQYIRAHADEYRIPSNRVAFAGFSNGGLTGEHVIKHYSGSKTLKDLYPDYIPDELDTYKACPDVYLCIYGPRFDGMEFDYSDVNYPPTFIAAGMEDAAAIGNLRWLYNDLITHGVKAEVHTFAGAPHGIAGMALVDGKEKYPNFALWTTLADAFMQDVYNKY